MRDGVGSIVVELGNDARARYRGADTGLELQPRLAADAPTMDVVGPAGFGTPRRSVDIV
jgi:hypothetical protein